MANECPEFVNRFRVTRRSFVATALALAASRGAPAAGRRRGHSFDHGVASGDPLHDRVIIWSRVTPKNWERGVTVKWRLARDPQMRRIVARGSVETDILRDFTVKVDVTGLEPSQTYYFQFRTHGASSVVGRTRTLAPDAQAARLAMVSCANLPAGLFNVYALLARRADLDAVLHLGDYLYEYRNGTFGDGTALGRVPVPDREILSLVDYRQRHAQYKLDADLQAAHRQHPFICVWDDHEFANNTWKDGAGNHNPDQGEGDWSTRQQAAMRAYFEWMPIREWAQPAEVRIYRQFRFGRLADLLMLDTRAHGRDQQSHAPFAGPDVGYRADDPVANDPARTLLGMDQEQWLAENLAQSRADGVTWQLLGQQVLMAQLSLSRGQSMLNFDVWDGYVAARRRLFDSVREPRIGNLVVLSGDIHSSWANELTLDPWDATVYDPATGRGVLGVEFATPAVSSPGIADAAQAARRAERFRSTSPHVKYVELRERGYVLLDLDHQRLQAEFWHVATVDAPSREETMAAAFVNEAGASRLQPVATPSAARQQIEPAT
ncbi:MAG TPA: alkaline phosphatase D family protein [Steroidobacteraceae bacterium]